MRFLRTKLFYNEKTNYGIITTATSKDNKSKDMKMENDHNYLYYILTIFQLTDFLHEYQLHAILLS